MSTGRYDGVQALRFVAALMVVVMHAIRYTWERLQPGTAPLIWEPGNSGVDVFFVISGFVITIASRDQVRRGAWREFIARRIARIVPLYWILTTFKVAITALQPSLVLHAKLAALPIALSYLFLPSFNAEGTIFPFVGVGWTLNFEMFFYALFTLAIILRLDPLKFCAPILIACSAALMFRQADWPAASFYLDDIVLEFLMGMALARIAMRGFQLNRYIASALAVAGLALLLMPPFPLNSVPRSVGRGLPAFALVTGVVYLEAWWSGRVPHFLVNLGDASYALYLIHPFIAPAIPLLLLKLGVLSFELSVAGGISASIVASWIAWKYIDLPLSRGAARRIVPRRPAAEQNAPVTAAPSRSVP